MMLSLLVQVRRVQQKLENPDEAAVGQAEAKSRPSKVVNYFMGVDKTFFKN